MTPDLSKIEYASIHIASGVHGTVPADQLATTSVEIAAAVLTACDDWTAAQAEAEREAAAKAKAEAADKKKADKEAK